MVSRVGTVPVPTSARSPVPGPLPQASQSERGSPAMTRDLRAVDRSVIALGIFGAILVLAATRWGIGLGTDSLSFIEAARNMAKGQGLATQTEAGVMEPMTHWPPL